MIRLKRLVLLVVMACLLCGCRENEEWSSVLQTRQRLLQAGGCSFDMKITADYGDVLHVFAMNCSADAKGTVSFTVTQPQTIAGITGNISAEEGTLTFDDHILVFELMAEGRLSPVAAPWVVIHGLRSGYIRSYSPCEDGVSIRIDDTYEADAMQIDILMDSLWLPQNADIYWNGTRILTAQVENFEYL